MYIDHSLEVTWELISNEELLLTFTNRHMGFVGIGFGEEKEGADMLICNRKGDHNGIVKDYTLKKDEHGRLIPILDEEYK